MGFVVKIDTTIKYRVLEFLSNYGDKGFIVLKTALETALDPNIDHRLGDFSFKYLVFKLRKLGINYNPANLLRILEKEYGIIEKSYSSSNQKWWTFVDLETTRRALLEYSGSTEVNEPKLRLLLIKYKSLEPSRILTTLRRLSFKNTLNAIDKKVFREIVFNELDQIVTILEEMMAYEDIFNEEILVLEEIISLAEMIASKIETGLKQKTSKVEKPLTLKKYEENLEL